MSRLLQTISYLSTVRAAHNLAALLKEKYPPIQSRVEELQVAVTHYHSELDNIASRLELAEQDNGKQGRQTTDLSPATSALIYEMIQHLENLEAAYQSLLDLKHPNGRIQHNQM